MNHNRHATMLATVLAKIGPGKPTIDQRLCDALFDITIAGRGGSPKPLWENASKRVATELEAIVRQRRKRTERAWTFTPSQRRALADQIRRSVFTGTQIDLLIELRSRRLIFDALRRVDERHTEAVDTIAFDIPTKGVFEWLCYWAVERDRCSAKDRDIIKRQLYTCQWVGFCLMTWRELCS